MPIPPFSPLPNADLESLTAQFATNHPNRKPPTFESLDLYNMAEAKLRASGYIFCHWSWVPPGQTCDTCQLQAKARLEARVALDRAEAAARPDQHRCPKCKTWRPNGPTPCVACQGLAASRHTKACRRCHIAPAVRPRSTCDNCHEATRATLRANAAKAVATRMALRAARAANAAKAGALTSAGG